jgi:hypothetical protein
MGGRSRHAEQYSSRPKTETCQSVQSQRTLLLNEKAGPLGRPFFLAMRMRFGGRAYDPRRPDFIDVAGGFPALTGGAGGGAGGCSLVGSITEGGGAPFLFFEKSGISFFRFIVVSVQKGRSQRHYKTKLGARHWYCASGGELLALESHARDSPPARTPICLHSRQYSGATGDAFSYAKALLTPSSVSTAGLPDKSFSIRKAASARTINHKAHQ